MTESQLLERLIEEAAKCGVAERERNDIKQTLGETIGELQRVAVVADDRLKIIEAANEQIGQLRVDLHNLRSQEATKASVLHSLVEEVNYFVSTTRKKAALPSLKKQLEAADRVLGEWIPF